MKKGAAKLLEGRTILIVAALFLVFSIFANMFIYDFNNHTNAIEKFSDCASAGVCSM